MDQRFLAATCRIIVGSNGRRLPAYGSVESAFAQGLFRDYFTRRPLVSSKTFYKYLGAVTPFPHFLIRHYGGSDGYRRTLSDMMELVDGCPSIRLLCLIQAELHQCVSAYLPTDEACGVCKNYVNQNPTRREIALYLADVLHYAIVRNPVEN